MGWNLWKKGRLSRHSRRAMVQLRVQNLIRARSDANIFPYFQPLVSLFFNCDVAIRNWSKVNRMLNQNHANSSCKELIEIIHKNPELVEYLISTSLTGRCLGPKKGFWKSLTDRQSKRSFLNGITKLTNFGNHVKNSTELLTPFQQFYEPDEFEQLQEIYESVRNKTDLLEEHKKNFVSIINYLIMTMKPNDYSNLESIIGKI